MGLCTAWALVDGHVVESCIISLQKGFIVLLRSALVSPSDLSKVGEVSLSLQ